MPMPTDSNTDYSLIYALLAVVVICCLAIADPLFIRPAFQKVKGNLELADFETAFQEVQHPEGTSRASLKTAVGDFTDSDRGCDFFLGELRRFDGDEESIQAAYAGQAVSDHPLQVLFLEDGQIPAQLSGTLPDPLDTLAGWEMPPGAEQQPVYMVYILVTGFEGDMKLDCR